MTEDEYWRHQDKMHKTERIFGAIRFIIFLAAVAVVLYSLATRVQWYISSSEELGLGFVWIMR